MELKDHHGDENSADKYLNAFDIISYSSGANLSGMFKKPDNSVKGERFISAEAPETILAKVEEVGKTENVAVVKKQGWSVKMEGQNGKFQMTVSVQRLTEKLVVVEIKRSTVGVEQMWKDKLRPQLNSLIYQPPSTS